MPPKKAAALAPRFNTPVETTEGFVTFSVPHPRRLATFEIPANLPPPGDNVLCQWSWVGQETGSEWYMQDFECNITGGRPAAKPVALVEPTTGKGKYRANGRYHAKKIAEKEDPIKSNDTVGVRSQAVQFALKEEENVERDVDVEYYASNDTENVDEDGEDVEYEGEGEIEEADVDPGEVEYEEVEEENDEAGDANEDNVEYIEDNESKDRINDD
ncbi:hypothetical protein K469DRAFT_748833 [Zopfia rhizophila CBS 207.26]|uniref:Uncharacterized protein n=1 Tax=Zopfia rhizophila CBS 207.26 TaxID=1314779 RepID=A0A6A6E6U6_9PEZI|nr:hypothetical protein K469DRAFT_748833 [Zopfia rhizophila CBS 207.26]